MLSSNKPQNHANIHGEEKSLVKCQKMMDAFLKSKGITT
jgi:hypothetical protein